MNALFALIAFSFVVMLSMPCYSIWQHYTWERDERKRLEHAAARFNEERKLYLEKGWGSGLAHTTPVKPARVRTGPFSYEWKLVHDE